MKKFALAASLTALISACGQPPKPANQGIDFNVARLGVMLDEIEKPSAEIQRLEKIAAANSKDPEAQFNVGRAYAKAADSEHSNVKRGKALEYFARTLALAPGNQSTLNAIYDLRYRQTLEDGEESFGELKKVFAELDQGTQQDLNPPSLALFIYHYVDQSQSSYKDYGQLQKILLDAIAEQPHSDTVYIQLAALYRQQGYYPLALATLKEASRQLDKSDDLLRAIAKTYEARAESEGCSYERNGYLNDAIDFYKRAVPVNTKVGETHYKLAGLYLDQNQPQLAMNEAQILYDLDAKPENLSFIAEQYAIQGNFDKALEFIAKAQAQGLDKGDTAIHEIYMYAGRWTEAASAFRAYLAGQKFLSVYDRIKADILSERTGEDLTGATQGLKVHSYSDWESAVYAFWSQKLSVEQLQTQVHNTCERTEFYFYSGYRDLIAGNTQRARSAFSAALKQKTYRFIERPLARQFLTSMPASH